MATQGPDDLVRESRLIFRGTVERLNAATMPAVPVTESTAVVKVDEVLQAPAALGDLTGQEITVQLAGPQPTRTRQQAVFFTNPWLYGDSLAVQEVGRQEVGRREAGADLARLREQVAEVTGRLPDEALQRRLSEADLVVAGTVLNNRPV